MSSLDLNQARLYIELLRDDPTSKVHWQIFSDSKESIKPFEGYYSLEEMTSTLQQYQSAGCGVYITINPTDGYGRKRENIKSYDWLFADLDGKELPQSFPLTPLFITGRDPLHTHVYWPISECVTELQYSTLQRRVALFLGSDTQVIDTARVARVPGTYQLKDKQNPKQYQIYQNNSATIDYSYTVEEVEKAFYLGEQGERELQQWILSRESKGEGTGFTDDPVYIKQCEHYFTHVGKPSGAEGTNRSLNVIRNAGYAYDRGVSLPICQQLMWEHFNPRCEPPWDDQRVFYTYVERAYQYASNAPGCMTAVAVFKGREAPEPTGGWEANKKLKTEKSEPTLKYIAPENDDHLGDISYEVALTLKAGLTSKSSAHDQAIAFIGTNYPDKKLLRHESIFYSYNGKHWSMIDDDQIIYEIEYDMRSLKLAPNKIKNIFTKVCNMSYQSGDIKFRSWLSDPERDSNSFIARNGIIEITKDKLIIHEHTPDYFDLNMVDIDYDPNAKCYEFLEFIESQFPGDKELQRQIQDLYGMALVQSSKHQVLPIFVGKSRSGKGVHTKLITKLVGRSNTCAPSLEGLCDDSKVMEMTKAKVALIPEANGLPANKKDIILDRLKMFTGGDTLTIDRKYKSAFSNDRWPLMIIAANELPQFVDSSEAYANRVYPIPFHISFYGREDKTLFNRLSSPKELSGIFTWALEGAIRVLQSEKLELAEASKEMIEDIRYESFPLSKFIADFCVIDPKAVTDIDEVYTAYLKHCRANGVKMSLSQNKFTRSIVASALTVTKKRQSSGKHRGYNFIGLGLDTDAIEKVVPIISGKSLDPTNVGFKNVTKLEKKS